MRVLAFLVIFLLELTTAIERRTIKVQDSTGLTVRHYTIAVPKSYDGSLAVPLLMWFHGQSDEWCKTTDQEAGYGTLGEKHGFIRVYPRGIGDYNGKDRENMIAWNVGLLDHGMDLANKTCFADTEPSCYDSCGGVCSQCSWSTCVDDVHFIKELVAELSTEFKISSVFASGGSNGGMFTHYLASREPQLLRAVAPVFGLPLVGMLHVPPALAAVPIVQIHDRSDTTIPWQGGMTSDGWIYESLTTTLAAWARVHSCKSSRKLRGVNTPFDGGNADFRCMQYQQCAGRVVSCFYDGHHGTWPASGQIEKITWWFFSQFLSTNAQNSTASAA